MLIAAVSLSTFSLLSLMEPPQTSAGAIEKTFELGPGTQNSTIATQTFAVPSGLPVTATIEFRRLGDAGNPNDIPIIFELRHPGTSPGQFGTIVQQTISLAERNQKVVTLNGTSSTRGCSNPWSVRLKYDPLPSDPPIPRFDVIGKIRLNFNDRTKGLDINPDNINIAKGNTVVKGLRVFDPASGNVTQAFGGSGRVRVRAEWHTSPLELLHFNQYYKLTVRLKRDGSTVESESGFSQHAPSDKTPKLDFTHFIAPDQASGNWQLEIESFAPADIVDFHIREAGQFGSTFTPSCN